MSVTTCLYTNPDRPGCNAGDLLGSEPEAPPAAASNTDGMFAGLDVGSSPQQPSQSATAKAPAPTAPQSPFDALAGLQGSSASHSGTLGSFAHPPQKPELCQACRLLHARVDLSQQILMWHCQHRDISTLHLKGSVCTCFGRKAPQRMIPRQPIPPTPIFFGDTLLLLFCLHC